MNAGKYEFVRAKGAVGAGGCAAGQVSITGSGTNNGLLNAYTNSNATATKGQARFQVVRVPQYTSATLNGVTAAPWVTNTAAPIGLGTGGVLAIDVAGTLTVNAGVAASVDGQGFRGAAGRQLNGGGPATNTDYRNPSTVTTHGGKGEGGAGTPRWVFDPNGSHACGGAIGAAPDYYIDTQQPNDGYPNGSMARGAPANAGGGSTDGNSGGNDQNSGGGGGSNGGAGGRGGFSWNTGLNNGGLGAAVTPALTKLVLGGGGGAGTRNNGDCGVNGATAAQEGQSSSGAAGGGLIVLRAGSLVAASGAILSADGNAAFDDTLNDGGGGGGAGGSVIVAVTSGDLSNLTIRARGGKGGSSWKLSPPGTPGEFTVGAANLRHGPGGGGGGGVVVYTNTAVAPTLDVAGGSAGTTTTANSYFGALPGDDGQTLLAAPGLIPGAGSASDCSSDLSVTLAHQETTVTPGGTATFLATVSNAAPFVATSGLVTVVITLDPWLTPTLASGTGWTCGIAGQVVTCTRSDALAAKLSYPPISITANVLAGAPNLLSNTATVSNAGDFNAGNNTTGDAVGVRGTDPGGRAGVQGGARRRQSASALEYQLRVEQPRFPDLSRVGPCPRARHAFRDRRVRPLHREPAPGGPPIVAIRGSTILRVPTPSTGSRTSTSTVLAQRPGGRSRPRPGTAISSRGAGDDVPSPLLSDLGRKRFDRDSIRRVVDRAPRSPRPRTPPSNSSCDRMGGTASRGMSFAPPAGTPARTRRRCSSSPPGSSRPCWSATAETGCCTAPTRSSSTAPGPTVSTTTPGSIGSWPGVAGDCGSRRAAHSGTGCRAGEFSVHGRTKRPHPGLSWADEQRRQRQLLRRRRELRPDRRMLLLLTNIDRDASLEPTLTVALQGATAGTVHQVDVTVNGSAPVR